MSSPPSCYLGIMPSKKYALLGDTFMRSAYAVFDQDSDTVFLAQYQNCGSDLKTISRPSDIQRMVGSCTAPKTGGDDKNKEDKDDSKNNDSKNHDSSKDIPFVSLDSKSTSTSASHTAHPTTSSVARASASATVTSITKVSASASASKVSSAPSSSAVPTQTLSDTEDSDIDLGEAKQKDQGQDEEVNDTKEGDKSNNVQGLGTEPNQKDGKPDNSKNAKGLGFEEDANAGGAALSARLGLAIAVVAAMVML
jgi:hypothetical protein